MTDEEISKEIAEKTLGELATSFLGYIDEVSEMFCECAAMNMAKWQRNYLEELLEKEISSVNEYYDRRLNQHQLDQHIGKVDLLADLLGIEFPFDKLHMAFATMD